MKILVVEDEKHIYQPLKVGLEGNNYAVDVVTDGEQAISEATINSYDCILLDLNLPKMDGMEVAKTLRDRGNTTPILMLTSKGMIEDKIDGLSTGADDYLTKPFNFKELLLRIENLIKRSKPINSETLVVAGITLDPRAVEVSVGGERTELNRKEYGILLYLMRHEGEVVSQGDLIEHVWSTQDGDLFSHSLRTQILNLRKKVDPGRQLIQTVKGHGYKIAATN